MIQLRALNLGHADVQLQFSIHKYWLCIGDQALCWTLMLWKRAGRMELTLQQGGWTLNEPPPVGWKLHKEKCKHSQGYITSARLRQNGGSSELCIWRGNSQISLVLCQGQAAFLLSLSMHEKLLGHSGCVLNRTLLAKVKGSPKFSVGRNGPSPTPLWEFKQVYPF